MNYLKKRLRGFNRAPRLTATLVLLVLALSVMGAQAALAASFAWSPTGSSGCRPL